MIFIIYDTIGKSINGSNDGDIGSKELPSIKKK